MNYDIEIKIVKKQSLNTFIDFPDSLYKGDDKFVPYMKADLRKTLKKLLFKEKKYTALLAYKDKKPVGRILLTIAPNKQFSTEKCGFFSLYECIDDIKVSNALLSKSEEILKEKGALYLSGTYCPFDEDNRRGIMIQGFEKAPLIFTSYNKEYYKNQMEEYGLLKNTDAYEFGCLLSGIDKKIIKLGDYALKRTNTHIDHLNKSNLDKDIQDFCCVMKEATTELNYQDALDENALINIVKQWKNYLNKDYILFVRENETNKPVGFAVAIENYFQMFKAAKGRITPLSLIKMAIAKKKITSIRAMLQYVIPEYQSRGSLISLYSEMFKVAEKNKINYVEFGTIMEKNSASFSPIQTIGGKLARIYRIYYKEID